MSSIRIDDIDVYLRIVTYEEKINKQADKFIHRIKWLPLRHRQDIFEDSIQQFQDIKQVNIQQQKQRITLMQNKAQELI